MTSQSFDEFGPISAGTYVVGAVVGAFFGGLAAAILFVIFVVLPADWLAPGSPLHWAVGLAGAACGAVRNVRTVSRSARRQAGFEETAASLGFAAAAGRAERIGRSVRALLGRVDGFELRAPHLRSAGEVASALGEVRWEDDALLRDERTAYQRTFALFEIPGVGLPVFVVKPDAWRLVAPLKVSRSEEVDFTDRVGFSKIYQVSADDPRAVRRLLTDEVLTFLECRPGLELLAAGDRLAVFCAGGLVPADELAEFVDAAQALARLLAAAAGSPAPAAAERGSDHAADPPRSFWWVWTRAGSRIESQRRDRAAIGRLLDRTPPRAVPWRLAIKRLGCGGLMALVAGFWFIALGVAFGLPSWGIGGDDPLPALASAALFPAVGITLLIWGFRYRRRVLRVLREGEARRAVVVSVDPTEYYLNGDRRYRVRMELREGEPRPVEAHACGAEGDRAECLRQSGEAIRVLIDPQDPGRAVWLDEGGGQRG